MSRVYKQQEVILGQNKIVEVKVNPVIKVDEGKTESLDLANNKNAKHVEVKAQEEANKIINNAQLHYDDILQKAIQEKEAIISNAKLEASKIFESAKEKGYEEGYLEGQNTGFLKVDSLIQEAKEIKQDMLVEKKHMAKALESEVIELVISCVKKIIDHELAENNDSLLNLVKKGIEKCIYTDSLIFRVSENDYNIVNSYKNKIYTMTTGIDNIEIKKDPALPDGSLIIETASGTVEASTQTQIEHIKQKFYEILKGE